MKRVLGLVLCLVVAFGFGLSFGSVLADADKVITGSSPASEKMGIHNGYNYEFWTEDGSGSASMTLRADGAFDCEWNNIENALFRKGLKYDTKKTHSEIGEFTIEYEGEYNPRGVSYLSVYGWTVNPLIEYYIIENYHPSYFPAGGAQAKGSITIDGGTYDIYETLREQKPSIQGTATFKQYWSIRRTKRTGGTISVSEHFKKWESLGMTMGGGLYEVSLVVEGYRSSGSANITKNVLTVQDELSVKVNGGKFIGTVAAGNTITVTADIPTGYKLDGFTVNKGEVTLTPSASNSVTFTMPSRSVEITANLIKRTYIIETTNASYTGVAQVGEVIEITADPPQEGATFDRWVVVGLDSGDLLEVQEDTFIMPASNVAIVAYYKTQPLFDTEPPKTQTEGGCQNRLDILGGVAMLLALFAVKRTLKV